MDLDIDESRLSVTLTTTTQVCDFADSGRSVSDSDLMNESHFDLDSNIYDFIRITVTNYQYSQSITALK